MDYFYFFLFVVVLVGALVLLMRIDARIKRRYRKDAYTLLEDPSPSAADVRRTIKGLRLYGGRWRRNKEFIQLTERLIERLKDIKE
jgi:hypothetical protein